ncbi:amino acid transporter AVT6C-like isoform X1 [Amaranthus tricolor]|uniref:amino acid transporter AVT6C-like isoform X1 n=1 Tax=Amaranthus tricolor TaxID=29722 RepID=UPI002584951A|nr:amino acid transporter AVT6C-like isoform X1 [Amaranthus tricolor]
MDKEERDTEVVIPLLQGIKSPLDATERKGASLASAIFNISTTMIGAGIMSIPATFKVLGIFPALIIILVIALIGDITGEFMLRYTHSGRSTTYGGLMGESFGKLGSLALQICIIITSFGCLIIYLIIIGDVLSGTESGDAIHTGLLQEWFGFYWWTSRAFAILLVVLLVILPLVLFRRVDSLRYTSLLAILLAAVFIVISSFMAIKALFEGKTQNLRLMPDFSDKGVIHSLFTTIPVFVTAFGFQVNVHPIRAELGEPSDMRLAIRISLLICAVFYFSIGFFGYLLFGDSVNADMLVNFDQISHDTVIASVINVIVRLSYAFHLMLVFPMLNYCLRANINELIYPGKLDLAEDKTRFMCLTAILLILAYVVAIAIPSIWCCFQILGSTTIICLMLIFPSMIVLRDIHGISSVWEKVVAVMLIIAALFASIIAMYTNLSTLTGSKAN